MTLNAAKHDPPKTWLSDEARSFSQQVAQRPGVRPLRHSYYHYDTYDFCQRVIQTDSRVLLVGWNVRDLAESLQCARLYVLDIDPSESHFSAGGSIQRIEQLDDAFRDGPIDYVLLPYTLQFLEDIQSFLSTLREHLPPDTRLVILQYNFLWAPVLRLAQKLRLRRALPDLNWLNIPDVENLLTLTRYQKITVGARCLIPFRIPGVSFLVNRYLAPLPFFQWLGQKTYVIARPDTSQRTPIAPTTSIVVPARNEEGNIRPLLDRLPKLGERCEVIFVEGHSKDDTWGEIQRQIQTHPRRQEFEFHCFKQQKEGKADATRFGFSHARGDLLMILDADLSVQPEDLEHFYSAFRAGAGEFLNGARLIYKMEAAAMQVLNLFFNKLFALWVSWLIGQPVKDTLCGTKALWRKDYERIHTHYTDLLASDPFGDFELLFGASRLNLKICDLPVRYKSRTYGNTNILRFRHGWQLLKLCCSNWAHLK